MGKCHPSVPEVTAAALSWGCFWKNDGSFKEGVSQFSYIVWEINSSLNSSVTRKSSYFFKRKFVTNLIFSFHPKEIV